jgi:hypothetical protein
MHTLTPVAKSAIARQLDGTRVADPEQSGVSWSYAFREGSLVAERQEEADVRRAILEYAFGSGRHATTFVSLTNRTPQGPAILEHRLTVFAGKAEPDITPGQAVGGDPAGIQAMGRDYPAAKAYQCFECHATLTSRRDRTRLDTATMVPNIGCERCHGPGRAHVEAARSGAGPAALAMTHGPDRASAAEQIAMCGACHRLPSMGDPGLVRTDNPVLVRFQPVGLMQSACYKKAEGKLSCVSCHDPHARTSSDRAAYEEVCRSCHGAPDQVACKVAPASGCLECHMPRRDVSRDMMMTDHWIRILSPEEKSER